MDFGEVLSKAWQIIWKHKVLWIFGILTSCGGGNSASSNSGWRSSFEQNGGNFPNIFANLTDWQIALIIAIILLVIFVLVVLAVFLSTVGRIGMIRGTVQGDRGAERLSFSELFSGSLPYFWRVFGLNLLVGLAFAAAIIVVVFTLIIPMAITVIGLACAIPLICLLIPIGWFVSVLTEQANIAIVTENLGIIDGLKRGYEVLRTNLGPMIVMWLILGLGVSLVGGLIIGLPIAFIIGPAVAGAIIGSQQALGGGLAVTGLCFVAYLPVLIVANGILQSYIRSAWTLTYLRLTGKRPSVEVVAEPVE